MLTMHSVMISGILQIEKRPKPVEKVLVRVYKTNYEHFAVMYRMRGVLTESCPLATLNLRSCSVDVMDGFKSFHVTPRSGDDQGMTFSVLEGDTVDRWLNAFHSKVVKPNRTMLPVVLESDEEEQELPQCSSPISTVYRQKVC